MAVVVVTFPSDKLLYPVTNEEKLLTIDTSRKYPVAAVLALQLALNALSVIPVEALSTDRKSVV